MVNRLEITPAFNHTAIQTDDVDSTIRRYEQFIGATVEWLLDTFSPLTHARGPGIERLVELTKRDLRLHVFDRAEHAQDGPRPLDFQVQHRGTSVERPDELAEGCSRWRQQRLPSCSRGCCSCRTPATVMTRAQTSCLPAGVPPTSVVEWLCNARPSAARGRPTTDPCGGSCGAGARGRAAGRAPLRRRRSRSTARHTTTSPTISCPAVGRCSSSRPAARARSCGRRRIS